MAAYAPSQPMKTCSDCHIYKPESDFYQNHGYLQPYCKTCSKARTKAYRLTPEGRLTGRKTNHKRYLKNKSDPEWRKRQDLRHRRWMKRHPEKPRAHNTLCRAVKHGLIIPQPCEMCGHSPVEAHHDDYSKPLQVRWLCNAHHRAIHSAFIP